METAQSTHAVATIAPSGGNTCKVAVAARCSEEFRGTRSSFG